MCMYISFATFLWRYAASCARVARVEGWRVFSR